MAPTLEEDVTRPEHLDQVETDQIVLKPKQAKFIQSQAPYSAYGGGVGNGKTLAAIIKVYQHCEEQPGAYFLIGRKFFPELRDSTMRDFLQLMGNYGTFVAQDKKFLFPNGSEVIFRHLDNRDSLTNLNLSGFYVDQAEDIPEETFDYLSGRCRLQFNKKTGTHITQRLRMITFNPKGHDWIWRLFDQKKDADGFDLTSPEDYHLEIATTYENRDNLPADYLKSLESKPKEWKDRFIYGSFDVKAGRIFEEWAPAMHVIPEKYHFKIPEHWTKFRAIDHGQNNPTACLWMAADTDGNVYVYREYYKPNASVSWHTQRINVLSQEWSGSNLMPGEYQYTVIDPSTHAKTREKDGYRYSIADEYLDAGISTIGAQNDVGAGINRIREYMAPMQGHYHPFLLVKDITEGHPMYKDNFMRDPESPAINAPRLYIFSGCSNLIKELPEYEWQPLKYNQIGITNNNEKPVKNFDHATDALRYGIMSRPVTREDMQTMDPRIWNDSLQLALYARRMGLSKDELLEQRMGLQSGIKHSNGSGRITHSSGL